jgi:hypothetical protein
MSTRLLLGIFSEVAHAECNCKKLACRVRHTFEKNPPMLLSIIFSVVGINFFHRSIFAEYINAVLYELEELNVLGLVFYVCH